MSLAPALLTLGQMNIGLYQSASTLAALERWQDVVSRNISSAQNTSYRKRTIEFSTVAAGKWQINPDSRASSPDNEHAALFVQTAHGINFNPGENLPTRRELDVALQGDGFFVVEQPDGSRAYTRNGELRVLADRTLVNSAGLPVISTNDSPIKLLPGNGTVTIDREGTVLSGGTPVGKLGVKTFARPEQLIAANELFTAPPGVEPEDAEAFEVIQGYLEQSNIKPLTEMVDLVLIGRAYEANQKIITSADELMEKTLQALG